MNRHQMTKVGRPKSRGPRKADVGIEIGHGSQFLYDTIPSCFICRPWTVAIIGHPRPTTAQGFVLSRSIQCAMNRHTQFGISFSPSVIKVAADKYVESAGMIAVAAS